MVASRRLNQLTEQVAQTGGANRSDGLRILPLSRELAETRGELPLYPKIRFFADWSLHAKLDRKHAKSLLADIATIVENEWDGDAGKIVVRISEFLSPYALQKELAKLFESENIPPLLLGLPQPWTQIASWILQDLLDKPLIGSQFTEDEEKTGWGTTPRELRLIADPKPGSQIQWQINIGPRVRLVGNLIKV